MGTTSSDAYCQSLARVIGRLSVEAQRLTREIPLREGHLQELESRPAQDEAAMQRIANEIRLAREELGAAETDLVQMEVVFKRCCGSGAY
jgi:hypothetical protein